MPDQQEHDAPCAGSVHLPDPDLFGPLFSRVHSHSEQAEAGQEDADDGIHQQQVCHIGRSAVALHEYFVYIHIGEIFARVYLLPYSLQRFHPFLFLFVIQPDIKRSVVLVTGVVEVDQGWHRFFFQCIDIEAADNPTDRTCLFRIAGQDVPEGFVILADRLTNGVFTGRDQDVRISPVDVDRPAVFPHRFPGRQSLKDLQLQGLKEIFFP